MGKPEETSQRGAEENPTQLSDKFHLEPGDFVLTQCTYCVHFIPTHNIGTCPAFPGGVPAEIIAKRSIIGNDIPTSIKPFG